MTKETIVIKSKWISKKLLWLRVVSSVGRAINVVRDIRNLGFHVDLPLCLPATLRAEVLNLPAVTL